MRKTWILGGVVVTTIAVAAFVAGALWQGRPAPGTTAAPVSVAEMALPTEVPPPAVAPSAPPSEPDAPATAAAAPPAPEPTAALPPPPPAAPALPKLATREVGARPVHIVPENDPPPPPRPIDIGRSPAGAPESAARREPARAEPSRAAPTRPAAPQVAGTAQASGATALLVGGRPFNLFGVRPPSSGDRCISTTGVNVGPAPPCADKARATLAARLARNSGVSCRLPAPASGAAICLDSDGVDLGGLLVAEGLALADPSQSYDYVGAEQIARSQQRGLWRFR